MAEESLKSKTVHGLGWSAIDNVSKMGIMFIVSIVLARLLSPDEYGLIGILTIFISVFNAIVDSGFTNALIRKKLTINDLLQDGRTMEVNIKGSDTEHLLPGVYYYQIKLFESDSAKVTTIRNKTKFIIID